MMYLAITYLTKSSLYHLLLSLPTSVEGFAVNLGMKVFPRLKQLFSFFRLPEFILRKLPNVLSLRSQNQSE